MDTQTTQAIVIVLGHSLELDGTTRLLKTSHARVRGCEKIKLVLAWKFHLYWLVSQGWEVLLMLPEKKVNRESSSAVDLEIYTNDLPRKIGPLIQ